jgi:hypothetical protein
VKRIVLLVVGGTAATAASAAMLMAGPAAAAGKSHSVHLTARELQEVKTGSTSFVEMTAVFESGKKVGYDELSCSFPRSPGRCTFSLALKGGALEGHLTSPIGSTDKSTLKGKVTGALGKYAGDQGTIIGTINGKREKFTVTYHS